MTPEKRTAANVVQKDALNIVIACLALEKSCHNEAD